MLIFLAWDSFWPSYDKKDMVHTNHFFSNIQMPNESISCKVRLLIASYQMLFNTLLF